MVRTYISTPDRHSLFYRRFRKALQAAGAEVVESATTATAEFTLLADETGQRVLSVSARNIPREYEVFYAVTFSLKVGAESLIANESLVVTRAYTYDETQVLAKAAEEQILRRALAEDLARRVMQRIQALGASAALARP